MSWSTFSGHCLLAFLLGIAFGPFHWIWIGLGLSLIASIYVTQQHISTRECVMLLFCIVFGVFRFEHASFNDQHRRPFVSHHLSTTACLQPTTHPVVQSLRTSITQRIQQRLPGDSGALLAGTLYGERGLSTDMKMAFRQAGMTHLIAVSGSNLSIIAVALFSLFAKLILRKRTSVLLLCFAIGCFILFVGTQAPVVRAGLMAVLAQCAPLTGRLARPQRLLLVSCALFLLMRPCAFWFDPAFALSFFATWGLMSYGAYFEKQLEHFLPYESLRGLIAETAGATLMTLPYSAWAFGQVSLLGLVSNLAAVPLVPWAMGLGSLCVLLPVWSQACLPAQGVLQLILLIADTTQSSTIGYWESVLFSWPSFVTVQLLLSWKAWKLQSLTVDKDGINGVMSRFS